jgi:lipid-A-disaccharide synthase
MPLIGFAAGEASGDLLAAPVISALRERLPDLQCAGIAGDRMIEAGATAWWHVRELSVRGYAEVVRELPRLLRLRRQLRTRLQQSDAAAMVGVDSPDFNLRLEMQLRAAGMPTVQYVSPSIWAWRPRRIEKIRRAADRVLLVFPFEQKIYDEAGVAATYVGHPLASSIPVPADAIAARARLGLPADGPLIALLPGSRRAEVQHIGSPFIEAAILMLKTEPRLQFVVPVAEPSLRQWLDPALATAGMAAERIRLFTGGSHDCLEAADGVLVASGTATLETALFRKPMVIAYRMPATSYWIMRRMGEVKFFGLPNILAGETLVPELLQHEATPSALAAALLSLLNDAPRCARLRERFAAMHESLRRDTPSLAAEAIIATMKRQPVS